MVVEIMGLGFRVGPFLGTLNIRCRIIIGIQKGITFLTTTHVELRVRQGPSWRI